MEEHNKVRCLIDGIHCSDCKAAVTLTHADNRLRNDFDHFSQSKGHEEEGQPISAVHGNHHDGSQGHVGRGGGHSCGGYDSGRGGRRGGRGGRHSGRGRGYRQVSDRYYTEEEWYAMTYEDGQQVIGLRDHRTAPAEIQEHNASTVTRPPVAALAPAPAPAPAPAAA